MARAYSLDFRHSVLKSIQRGMKITAASEFFSITRKTIYNWMERLSECGSVNSKKTGPRGARKIVDLKTFKAFVIQKPDRTLSEMAEEWSGVSPDTIRRSLNKIGFSYKKNFWIQGTKRRKASIFSRSY